MAKNTTAATERPTPVTGKLPPGPVRLQKVLATGASLDQAVTKATKDTGRK